MSSGQPQLPDLLACSHLKAGRATGGEGGSPGTGFSRGRKSLFQGRRLLLLA